MTMTASIEDNKSITALPDWTSRPVLFYGARKSGTTMALNLMDGGEEMFVSPAEIKLKKFTSMEWGRGSKDKIQYFEESTILGWEYDNFDMDAYVEYIQKQGNAEGLKSLIQHDLYHQYLSLQKKPSRPKLCAIKEVGGNTDKIFELFQKLFPQGRRVMILRSPLMVTRSVIKNRQRRNIKMSLWQYYKQTRNPMIILCNQAKYFDQANVFFMSYESLTDHKKREDIQKNLCHYLSISWDKKFTTTSEFGVETVSRTSSEDTAKIFVKNKKWYDNLTSPQRIIVLLTRYLTTLELLLAGRYGDYKRSINFIKNA